MKNIFVSSDNILSALGLNTAQNFAQLKAAVSGIKKHSNAQMSDLPFYASLLEKSEEPINSNGKKYTKFEKMLIASIAGALKDSAVDITDKKTLLIISTTKGNISLLETEKNSNALNERMALHSSAKLIAEYFNHKNEPIVISNACISGLVAIITGARMIQSGEFENAVIAGADVISKFVLSGFQSFQAISEQPCRPFDKDRNGITLGEAAGTIIITSNKKKSNGIKIAGGSTSNDANHISGPSRTGQELSFAINNAMKEAKLSANDIDFISAHGTATIYNDEMEANAITLSGLENVPVNSLKGYYGHTLGAAGLIESIVSIHSLKNNIILPTIGFRQPGVTKPINITTEIINEPIKNCLKTASGFGGCNAAVIFSKA
ncbi:MAG: beta-ketoacyl synthase N-terminal-like domain-containing protein [Ferruginibacter sp.]